MSHCVGVHQNMLYANPISETMSCSLIKNLTVFEIHIPAFLKSHVYHAWSDIVFECWNCFPVIMLSGKVEGRNDGCIMLIC